MGIRKNTDQTGSVIFIILIAIALFASLSYAISTSSRSTGKSINDEEAEIIASEFIQSALSIRQAYKQLRLSGCSLTDIDLDEDPSNNTRRNPLSPSASGDFRCALFHVDGGQKKADSIPSALFESGATPLKWRHATSLRVGGVGTADKYELSLLIQALIDEKVCKALNKKLIYTEDIPFLNTNLDAKTYDGTFPTTNWDNLTDPLTFGKSMACIDTAYNSQRKNGFYLILEAR